MKKIEGYCNHCGKCCRREGGLMVNNCMIESHEDRCKFYVDNLPGDNVRGHCLIFGRGNTPIEKVKDRFGNTITKKQIRWFNQNCPGYPDPKDTAPLLPECSFEVVEI